MRRSQSINLEHFMSFNRIPADHQTRPTAWVPAPEFDPEDLKGKRADSEEQQQSRDDEADGAVLDACQTWASRRDIRKATGFGDGRRDRAIARLLKAKLLERQEETRRGKDCETFRKTIHAR